MWFFLAISSAAIYSLRSLLEKHSLKKVNPYILAFAVRFFALPLFFIPFLIGIAEFPILSQVPTNFWLAALFISCVSTPLEMIFFYKALQTEEVSFVVPLLGISPLITALISALILREFPSFWGVVGMFLVVLGLYILNLQKQHEHFLEPIKHLVQNSAFKYLVLMLLSYSLGIIVDKLAISYSNIYFYSLINYLFVSLALFVIARFKAKKNFGQLKTGLFSFTIIGLIVAGYTWLRFAALQSGNTGYVSATLSSSVLFSILLGILFFKEKMLPKNFS